VGSVIEILRNIVGSTGWLGTLFAVTAMIAASGFLAFDVFTPDNWLSALGTCAMLMGAVVGKRALDNSKLAKDGVGDNGK
jgi:hypothetical protein